MTTRNKPPKTKTPKTKNDIQLFFHCGRCLDDKPANTSPREWAALEVGWTQKGLQVWCKRHEINVAAIDFRGAKVAVNTGA